jgi:HK97 gp10 family phage protein
MANNIKISVKNLEQFKAKLKQMPVVLEKKLSKLLDKHALAIATKAKQLAPVDEGILRNAISADTSKSLIKFIVANTPYAAFVEFGTGKYAADYVSTLPDDWQTFASQFRGQKGAKSFDDFVKMNVRQSMMRSLI